MGIKMVTTQPSGFHLQFSFLCMYSQAEQLPYLTSILTALKRKLVYSKTVQNTYYKSKHSSEKLHILTNFLFLEGSTLSATEKSYSVLAIKYFNWRWSFWVSQSSHSISSRETKVVYWDSKRRHMYHLPFLFEILTSAPLNTNINIYLKY